MPKRKPGFSEAWKAELSFIRRSEKRRLSNDVSDRERWELTQGKNTGSNMASSPYLRL